MGQKKYDLIVIGGGPAGSEAAVTANEKGAKVALIERDHLGGTCLNYGCDPTKSLLYVAHLLHQARQGERYGLQIPTAHAVWPAVLDYVEQVLNEMRGGTPEEARMHWAEQGIDLYLDEGRFVSPHEVAVSEEILWGDRLIIAAGTETNVPPIDGLDKVDYITNVEAVSLNHIPKRLAVIGGGPLGLEFAQIFARFGSEVTVLESTPYILNTEDRELADKLVELLKKEGVQIKADVDIQRVETHKKMKRLTFQVGNGSRELLIVDEILLATGRRPALDDLNIQVAGVETNEQGIVVDDMLRTNVPHIWAVGDVTGGYQFTHVANRQGKVAGRNAFADEPEPFDDNVVPWAIYTYPTLAHVGQTEAQLKEAGIAYKVGCTILSDVAKAVTMDKTAGIIKLLVAPDGKILGAHILAQHAGDLIAPMVLAMKNGLPVETLVEAILPYPTLVAGLSTAASEVAAKTRKEW